MASRTHQLQGFRVPQSSKCLMFLLYSSESVRIVCGSAVASTQVQYVLLLDAMWARFEIVSLPTVFLCGAQLMRLLARACAPLPLAWRGVAWRTACARHWQRGVVVPLCVAGRGGAGARWRGVSIVRRGRHGYDAGRSLPRPTLWEPAGTRHRQLRAWWLAAHRWGVAGRGVARRGVARRVV